ncbi:MAG: hypothetical protein OD814_000255 [Candidatus Alkanophagales archaeon MCA70_species_1]|nr:hypothetical protein [Candidatus Alkanophaga volatiphilum]
MADLSGVAGGDVARKGQWIVLSGLILALGLLVVVLLLNQALSAGHRISQVEARFPSYEMNELYEETVRVAKLVKNESAFDDLMAWYAENVSEIYAAHGFIVNISVVKRDERSANIRIFLSNEKVNFTLGVYVERSIPLE